MHPEKKSKLERLYYRGNTPFFTARVDPRFSYSLYVPHRLDALDRNSTVLLVSVHGTGRMIQANRDLFAEFAEYHNCIVLAPLFPANVRGDGNLSGYKYIEEGGIRYDEVLIGMVDEVSQRYGISGDRLLMFGFSGGAHFTHRFTILHPERILAASMAAAGSVTLIDPEKPWWTGIRDVEERFGIAIDLGAYRGLPLHFVVGDSDQETWEITHQRGDPYFMEGANAAGTTRIERLQALARSFERQGASVHFEVVPGKTHEMAPMARRTRYFFSDIISGGSA